MTTPIEVVVRSTELCLWFGSWCADKDEWAVWAAWAQGVGSVLAIFAAIAIAAHQQRSAKMAADSARTEARSRAERLVALYADTLVDTLDLMADACRMLDREALNTRAAALDDLERLGRQVPIDRLPIDAISSLLALQGIRTRAVVTLHTASSSVSDRFEEKFDQLVEDAHRETLVFSAQLGDSRAKEALVAARAGEAEF